MTASVPTAVVQWAVIPSWWPGHTGSSARPGHRHMASVCRPETCTAARSPPPRKRVTPEPTQESHRGNPYKNAAVVLPVGLNAKRESRDRTVMEATARRVTPVATCDARGARRRSRRQTNRPQHPRRLPRPRADLHPHRLSARLTHRQPTTHPRPARNPASPGQPSKTMPSRAAENRASGIDREIDHRGDHPCKSLCHRNDAIDIIGQASRRATWRPSPAARESSTEPR